MSQDQTVQQWTLLSLSCFFILLAGLLGGLMPLVLNKIIRSRNIFSIFNLFGAGMLSGVGLIIIMPQGLSQLYKSLDHGTNSFQEVLSKGGYYFGISLIVGFGVMMVVDQSFHIYEAYKIRIQMMKEEKERKIQYSNQFVKDQMKYKTKAQCSLSDCDVNNPHLHNDQQEVDVEFIVKNELSQSLKVNYPCNIQYQELKVKSRKGSQLQMTPEQLPQKKVIQNLRANLATYGFVFHCLADGMALGGSQMASKHDYTIGILIFLAILLHKIPALFGFSIFLLKEKQTNKSIIIRVTVVSLVSPVVALTTFTVSSFLFDISGDPYKEYFTSGMLLLISGGTFLYIVTLHILPQLKKFQEEDEVAQVKRNNQPVKNQLQEPLLTQENMEQFDRSNTVHNTKQFLKEGKSQLRKIADLLIIVAGLVFPIALKFT